MNRGEAAGRRPRGLWLAVPVLALLAGCSDSGREADGAMRMAQAPAPAPFVSAARDGSAAKLAYRHDLTVGLGPDRVAPHFAAARDRCLNEAATCTLLNSSIRDGNGASPPQAQIEVRLPHAAVAAYVAFVTGPLPGEAAGDVVLIEQATRAEDLTASIADTGRRLAQLNDYRTRLTALAEKPDNRAEDLIKIAGELAQVQSQIEEAEGTRRGLDERVDTEIVTVDFRTSRARAGAFAPVQEVWARSGPILGESAASALRFTVASLPWLPIVLFAALLLRLVWRIRRKRAHPARVPLEP
ncbi:DUF4349 domain-containing protein [Methylorubrum extorquens]|uniref:DUF4349 domain-containing protein n=1 Tax=Methylorubrum extorquens (strain CM4 / NCIMB 13688) TaxID=440085 RepID=B7KTQ1_METC4|nr:DUF4349 domain-containing protein [Methylorubrum extorquens]ACK82578.1 conserved hypothetical protein [Methylorubrum extorquens CM4]